MNCILLLMIKISIKHLLFRMWTIRAEGYYILKEKRGINIFWDEDFIESNKVVKAVPTDLKRRRFVDDDHHPSMTHRNHCERKRVFDTNKTYDLQKKYGLRLPCSCAFYYYYLNLEVKITFFFTGNSCCSYKTYISKLHRIRSDLCHRLKEAFDQEDETYGSLGEIWFF